MTNPTAPILVVEDIPNVRELLEVTLKFKGYPVITAVDGQDALDKINEQIPALIITDVLMPRVDGYALVYNLRTNPKTTHVPIVVISATYITPEDKNFAVSLGIARFIEKPIDTEDFLLTVAEVLTQGPSTLPRPLGTEEFWEGYRERLESKLRYKNTQIARTERLLNALPDEQRLSFQNMLDESIQDRDAIRRELDQLYQTLKTWRDSGPPEKGD